MRDDDRLLRSERRYRALLESLDQGFCVLEMIFDAQGQPVDYRFLEVNRMFEAQTGLVDAVGRNVRELVPGLEQRWFDLYGRVATTGESTRFIEGSEAMGRWFDVYAFRIGGDDSREVAVVFKDISEQRRHEQALRTFSERLTLAAQVAKLGSWELTLPERAVQASPQCKANLGLTRDAEVTFEDMFALTHPDDRAPVAEAFQAALDQRRDYIAEHRVVWPDGSVHWINVRAVHTVDEAGQPTGMLGVMHDVTDRRRVEDELREADRRKDDFLAMLAHELRNPLVPIRTSMHLLRMRPDADTVAHVGAVVDRQMDQLVRLVDDLMDVSRVTRGKVTLRTAPVEIEYVVANAVEACQPLIERAGHELALDIASEPLQVEGDAVRLAQVFTNLLGNAIKHNPAGTRIDVRVRRDGNEVLVEVGDDGVGIAPHDLDQVFELFTQLQAGKPAGLGIGLTLVRSLVELHGGRVAVASGGRGQGSHFSVRLPLLESPPAAVDDAPADERLDGLDVLVADDNRDAAASLALWLQALGASVRQCHDGTSALIAASERMPDALLLDLGMPGMDGWMVAGRMRRLPGGERAHLLAVSGWGQPEDVERSRQAGFDGHLVKPPDMAALQRMLAGVVRRKVD